MSKNDSHRPPKLMGGSASGRVYKARFKHLQYNYRVFDNNLNQKEN